MSLYRIHYVLCQRCKVENYGALDWIQIVYFEKIIRN